MAEFMGLRVVRKRDVCGTMLFFRSEPVKPVAGDIAVAEQLLGIKVNSAEFGVDVWQPLRHRRQVDGAGTAPTRFLPLSAP